MYNNLFKTSLAFPYKAKIIQFSFYAINKPGKSLFKNETIKICHMTLCQNDRPASWRILH